MNIFLMGAIVAILTLLVGAGIMALFVALSNTVTENYADIETFEKTRQMANVASTGGYKISAAATAAQQFKEARSIAAKAASKLPRGANMGIGRAGTTDAHKNKKHVTKGIGTDPMSELKIARFHTWNGLEVTKAVAAAPVAAAAGGERVKRKLVPGTDFAWIELKGLSGAEKRQAAIANGKAKSAAYKAAKASGMDMTAAAAAPVAAAAAPAAAAIPAGITLPPEPTYIEITDGMDPADKRSAKIANSKTKSAYNKALKALGVDPKAANAAELAKSAAAAVPAAAPVAAAAAVASAPSPAAGSANVPPAPDMIEITDDMAPDDKRSAKIANSKAKSAYKKQLKEMGIDPKSVAI